MIYALRIDGELKKLPSGKTSAAKAFVSAVVKASEGYGEEPVTVTVELLRARDDLLLKRCTIITENHL